VDAREHGRVAGTQGAGECFGEPERPPLQGDTGCPPPPTRPSCTTTGTPRAVAELMVASSSARSRTSN
jgi:hypothetical protein